MTTTTDEVWSVILANGVEIPLNTLAYNINTWGGDRQGVVPMRGSDQKIPWIPGNEELPRVPDSRSIGLQMWVIGATDSDLPPTDGTTARQQFNTNWRKLQRVLWNQGKIYTLQKLFYSEDGVLRKARARVRYQDGLIPEMMGLTGAKFTCDLWLADPFFYGDPVTIAFDTSAPATASYKGPILGDYPSRRVSITATAGVDGVTLPEIRCIDTDPPQDLIISTSLVAGQNLTLDIPTQTCTIDAFASASSVLNSGQNDWFLAFPGETQIDFVQLAGEWAGTLTYIPTWN